MIYIGIDPGKSGAMAVIDSDSNIIALTPFDEEEYRRVLTNLPLGDNAICCLEKVGAMPKQGVSSTFSFGENYGFIQGMLFAFYIPYQLVTPRKWKSAFSLNAEKADSIRVCKQLFPSANLKRTERCKTDHDGLAESLLLSLYAKRYL